MPLMNGDILTAVWLLSKTSVLLAVAAMTHALLCRRASAATRHLVWTLAVVGLLLLPVLSGLLPGWTATHLTSAPPSPTGSYAGISSSGVVAAATSQRNGYMAFDIPWSTALPGLYAAGVLLLLARLIGEQVMIQRLARCAPDMREAKVTHLLADCALRMGVRCPVRVLRSREHSMPMVLGTWVPAIVLPAVADTWSQDRRRAVLLHELAHVARHDCLTQVAAAVACAVYWIHPGVWWVARRLRVERELACDDRVLAAGTHAREYAGHLLELAHSLGGDRAPALVVGMARPQQLERRMLAALDAARNRTAPALSNRLAGIAIMAALLVPLAGAEVVVNPAGEENPTLVHLTPRIDAGPTILIHSIEFVGNEAISSATLKRQMKANKERSIWTRMFGGQSPYQAAELDEDAERIMAYYRDHGFVTARVGTPDLTLVRDSADAKTRFADLRIPVVEGHRYKVGAFTFDGNRVIKNDALRLMFKVEQGRYYSEGAIRNGLEKTRRAYGGAGYYEFTGYPDFTFRNVPNAVQADPPEGLKAASTNPATGPPIVDITVRLQEGKQFFVNRLTLKGRTTRETLIRREIGLIDGDVFNTEALKSGIRRLNKLGYFKPIAPTSVDIKKTPGEDTRVDLQLSVEDR